MVVFVIFQGPRLREVGFRSSQSPALCRQSSSSSSSRRSRGDTHREQTNRNTRKHKPTPSSLGNYQERSEHGMSATFLQQHSLQFPSYTERLYSTKWRKQSTVDEREVDTKAHFLYDSIGNSHEPNGTCINRTHQAVRRSAFSSRILRHLHLLVKTDFPPWWECQQNS